MTPGGTQERSQAASDLAVAGTANGDATIASVEAMDLELPYPTPFRPAWCPGLVSHSRPFTLVVVRTRQGLSGYSGTDGHHAAVVRRDVAPYLVGTPVHATEQHAPVFRNAGGMWFIDLALWDLIGKAAGLPLYKLWGRARDELPAYASTCTLGTPEDRAELATPRPAGAAGRATPPLPRPRVSCDEAAVPSRPVGGRSRPSRRGPGSGARSDVHGGRQPGDRPPESGALAGVGPPARAGRRARCPGARRAVAGRATVPVRLRQPRAALPGDFHLHRRRRGQPGAARVPLAHRARRVRHRAGRLHGVGRDLAAAQGRCRRRAVGTPFRPPSRPERAGARRPGAPRLLHAGHELG